MYIYREADIHEADRRAHRNGLSTNALMETAGRSLYEAIRPLLNEEDRILILAGKGNNGGDGVVLARYLHMNQFHVDLVFPFGLPESATSKEHFTYYRSLHYPFRMELDRTRTYTVIIDALLGVGTRLPLNEDYRKLLNWCNGENVLRIAIDLPTGVLADTGEADIATFQADYTFSLHGYKRSSFLLPAARYYGKVDALEIGMPQSGDWKIWTEDDAKRTLRRRDAHAHKGSFGTGLLFAGTDEMPGCALLAGLGAMRMGIGKLVIATTTKTQKFIGNTLPEATYWIDGLKECAEGEMLEDIAAVAIGPGLTDEETVKKALEHLWETELPLILDAGALLPGKFPLRTAPVIITPHPGEFSRMTGYSIPEIQKNRLELASQFAVDHQLIVVLKGMHTVIAFPDGTGLVNSSGNPALAKGGSGDTLTGMLLALVATEKDLKQAVANAVFLHGLCADEYVKRKEERTMLASDITDYLGTVLHQIVSD